MPTYDYECKSCGFKFEAFHAMSAESLIDCSKCHQPELIKLIGMGLSPIIHGDKTIEKRKPKLVDRLGRGVNKDKQPFWRDGPVNKKILKNPIKYIKEGKIN